MAAIKAGDRVQIVKREPTAEDAKSGLYYIYFGGLVGTVDRIYDDDSVCIEVDLESLNDDARKRHLEIQEAERKRWLDNLSGEARSRLSAEQRQLRMSYKILVGKKDLEPIKGGSPKKTAEKSGESKDAGAAGGEGPDGAPDTVSARAKPVEEEADAPRRVSEADLAKAEEEFLRSRQQK